MLQKVYKALIVFIFFLAYCNYFSLLNNATAQTSSVANDVSDMIKSVVTTVEIYNKSGMLGLEANVQKCYEDQRNHIYCLYLDIASRRIDQIFVDIMNIPPQDFFAIEQYGSRIFQVLFKLNMEQEAIDQYLSSIIPVINGMVEERLFDFK